jgi:RNA polymerase sigma-70 factor (ECF subfamily)
MFRAWVFQIARRLGMNAVRDRLAEHRRPPGLLRRIDTAPRGESTTSWGCDLPRATDPSPSAGAAAHEQVEQIRLAMDRLDDEDRQVVRLRFLEGMSLRQVAIRLGCNHEQVRRRFHAALRQLERELEGLR